MSVPRSRNGFAMDSDTDVQKLPLTFQGILNFRDVCAEKTTNGGKKLKRGRLFRSARLEEATQKDVDILINNLKIKTVLDLRSPNEVAGAKRKSAEPHYHNSFRISRDPRLCQRIHNVDFYPNFIKRAFWQADMWTRILFVFYLSTCQRSKAIFALCSRFLTSVSLSGMTILFMEACGEQIKEIFGVLANPEAYPIVLHCSAGKDRTGLSIGKFCHCDFLLSEIHNHCLSKALVSLLLDVPHETIVSDYHASRKHLDARYSTLIREMARIGLVRTLFIPCISPTHTYSAITG